MARMYVDIPSCLLSLFLVFTRLLLQLRILLIEITGMKDWLLFYFLIVAFAVIVGLFLFLVIRLLLQLHMSSVERLKIRESLMFGAFVTP